MGVDYLTTQNDDGSVLGTTSSDKIAFYGTTPTTQPAATAQSTVATTAITTVETYTTTVWAASINSLIARQAAVTTLVNRLRADLVTLGLIKGSA